MNRYKLVVLQIFFCFWTPLGLWAAEDCQSLLQKFQSPLMMPKPKTFHQFMGLLQPINRSSSKIKAEGESDLLSTEHMVRFLSCLAPSFRLQVSGANFNSIDPFDCTMSLNLHLAQKPQLGLTPLHEMGHFFTAYRTFSRSLQWTYPIQDQASREALGWGAEWLKNKAWHNSNAVLFKSSIPNTQIFHQNPDHYKSQFIGEEATLRFKELQYIFQLLDDIKKLPPLEKVQVYNALSFRVQTLINDLMAPSSSGLKPSGFYDTILTTLQTNLTLLGQGQLQIQEDVYLSEDSSTMSLDLTRNGPFLRQWRRAHRRGWCLTPFNSSKVAFAEFCINPFDLQFTTEGKDLVKTHPRIFGAFNPTVRASQHSRQLLEDLFKIQIEEAIAFFKKEQQSAIRLISALNAELEYLRQDLQQLPAESIYFIGNGPNDRIYSLAELREYLRQGREVILHFHNGGQQSSFIGTSPARPHFRWIDFDNFGHGQGLMISSKAPRGWDWMPSVKWIEVR